MSCETTIRVSGLGKRFEVFSSPSDRLLHMFTGPIARAIGRDPSANVREKWAVRDVSFEVARGETLGVIGRNGSGKSTLLQMICGTSFPTEGTVSVSGRVAALLELGAGFNPEFSGRENVYLNGMLLGLSHESVESRFDEIAAFADIGEYIDEPTKTYSSGMFVRLAFAVATAVDADVLIVDEALAVGDARFQAKCMKRIRQIQDAGASVLFVSHDVSSVRTLCQRSLWLEAGKMKMLGPVLQVTSRYMESIFADGAEDVVGVTSEADEQQVAGSLWPMEDQLTPRDGAVAIWEAEERSMEGNVDDSSEERSESLADGSGSRSEIDDRPVSHWGEQIGLIESVELLDANGKNVDLLRWGELCRIRVSFRLPVGCAPETFGVAFSIKDLKGSDIVVSSSHDLGLDAALGQSDGDRLAMEFSFENGLVDGKYFLVVALERRIGPVVEYYEYLEGARYFSSLASNRYFGVYQPRISQRGEVLDRAR